jgi:DNA polymerase-3 subunit alpha
MRKERQSFLDGAREQGYADDLANQLWEYIEPFAGYAFNKAHSACYALIAYQTAYVKAHYPAEWMAAVLTTDADNSDKVVSAIGECRRLGVELLRPDVNRGQKEFTVEPVPNGPLESRLGIRYGLAAVKNVGEAAVDVIVAERERGGPFASLDDFCRRVDLKTLNKRVIESLIKCGAFDEFGPRERVAAALDTCLGAAQHLQRAAGVGQTSLFDAMGGGQTEQAPALFSTPLPEREPLTPRQRLDWEKETLGLYFSDHPFQEASRWLAREEIVTTSEVSEEIVNQQVKMAGVVSQLRRIMTRKNKEMMAVATIEDLHGSIEVLVFPSTYSRTEGVWEEDATVVVSGRIGLRDEVLQLVAESAERFEIPDGPPPELADFAPELQPALAGSAAEPVAVNGHRKGNGGVNGNGNGHGIGHARGHATGQGNGHRSPEGAPRSRQRPTATERLDDRSGDDEPPPRRLRLVVQRSGDQERDIGLLEAIYRLLPPDGHDELELLLAGADRALRIVNPLARTSYSPALHEQLAALLGPDAVELSQPEE